MNSVDTHCRDIFQIYLFRFVLKYLSMLVIFLDICHKYILKRKSLVSIFYASQIDNITYIDVEFHTLPGLYFAAMFLTIVSTTL